MTVELNILKRPKILYNSKNVTHSKKGICQLGDTRITCAFFLTMFHPIPQQSVIIPRSILSPETLH